MELPELPQGISFFSPNEKAPDFIIGRISINPERFISYLNTLTPDTKGYIGFDVKMSKAGKPYVALDTYKKSDSEEVPF